MDHGSLPWGWAAARDKGRVYYYTRSGHVTWQRPTRMSVPIKLWEAGVVLTALSAVAVSVLLSSWSVIHGPPEAILQPSMVRHPWSSDGGELLSVPFWRRLGQPHGLSLSLASAARTDIPRQEVTLEQATSFRSDMRRNGYIHVPNLLGDEVSSRLASIVEDLEREGLPGLFMLVFDDVWSAVHSADVALGPLFGLQNIQDFYVFDVPPGGAGWPIHRDRSGGESDGFSSVTGLPLYTTVWLALTDATAQTSCIYCVPAYADANYGSQAAEDEASEILAASHQHITALPVQSGDALAWSHRLLHWGSASPAKASASRKALAFTMADPEYEAPSLVTTTTALAFPPFEARMALIAYSLICYHHSQPVPKRVVPVLLNVLRRDEFVSFLTPDALAAACGGAGFGANLRLAEESTTL